MTNDEINTIFNDDYKPPWMVVEEASVKKSLDDALIVATDFKWRLEAYQTLQRIAEKHGKQWSHKLLD